MVRAGSFAAEAARDDAFLWKAVRGRGRPRHKNSKGARGILLGAGRPAPLAGAVAVAAGVGQLLLWPTFYSGFFAQEQAAGLQGCVYYCGNKHAKSSPEA